jgi:hypothetical protein
VRQMSLLELPNPWRNQRCDRAFVPATRRGAAPDSHPDSLFSLTESDQATARKNHHIPEISFRQPQWMVVAVQKTSAGAAAGQAAPQEAWL